MALRTSGEKVFSGYKTKVIPLLPLRDIVVFPNMIVPLLVGRRPSILALEEAMSRDKKIFLVTQKDPRVETPKPSDLFNTGVIGEILQMLKMPDGAYKILVEGLIRARIREFLPNRDFFTVRVEKIEERVVKDLATEALVRSIISQFNQYVKMNPQTPVDLLSTAGEIREPGRLADFLASRISFKTEDKIKILEAEDVQERLKRLSFVLNTEIEVMGLEKKIESRIREQIGKTQKEYYLQEQMKAIQKELGKTEETPEIKELREKILKAKMSKEAEEKSLKELERLAKMMPMSPEATVIRNYLDWMISMPWSVKTNDRLDIEKCKEILDEDHYGLEKVKERILEFLAVRKLVNKIKGPILCFVGPPGVGKTSVARSIARALGRNFVRVSLGGVRDEAEIRGHRRTYIGALPGKIIQMMKKAKSKNPVFLMDEIDKMSVDFRGDPSAALLEVLDPEQNHSFNDHYLDVDFDLSDVFFITTANNTHAIPIPLQDRMEIVQFPGYTDEEKLKIAQKFLIPKQLKENGLTERLLSISPAALSKIIAEYTREAGVRNLEREIASICRKVARKIAQKKEKKHIRVTAASLSGYLGSPKFFTTEAEKKDEVGVAMGLAWTEAGGEILSTEAMVMKGRGKLILTGKLGEVMQESAQAALSFVRSRAKGLDLKDGFYKDIDIHIHVPEGAIPKDGPSAGITMATALASALTKRPVRRDVAMSGEITLRGHVLPVGGVKNKVLAAHRSGIKTVILPRKNRKDLEDIPPNIKRQLNFILVDNMDQVLDVALRKESGGDG